MLPDKQEHAGGEMEEQLRSKMVKDRLRAEAGEQRLRAEIDASLEKRMRGDDG